MSEFLYKKSLVGEEEVESGVGFHLTWEMLRLALVEKEEMENSEEIYQIGIREDGVTLFVRGE